MPVSAITIDTMRTAFARYAETHEGASIQRCWLTWNVLCTYLYTAELIASNPMPMVGRPKLAKTLSKALPADALAVIREWSPKMDGIAGTIWASQTTSSTWPPRHL